MSSSGGRFEEMPKGWEDDPNAETEEDEEFIDEESMWSVSTKSALPPVFGRYDRDTGERLMHYSDDVVQASNKDDEFDWTDSEGTSIDIGF